MWLYTRWTSLSAHRTPATTPWRSGTTCRGPRENCTYNIRDIVNSVSVSAAIILPIDNTMVILLHLGMIGIIICYTDNLVLNFHSLHKKTGILTRLIIASHCDQNLKRYYSSLDFTGHISAFKKNILAKFYHYKGQY